MTQEISQATPGVPGTPEKDDSFGESHTAYDRNKDGRDDLVIGAPYEDVGSGLNAGAVTIIPGSETGLDTLRSEASARTRPGSPGLPRTGTGSECHWRPGPPPAARRTC